MARHAHDVGDQPQTGLLTRLVPDSLKHTAFYRLLLRLTRVLQFLSAVISLGIFSSRVYKVYRLINSVKTYRGLSRAEGAVEGILAAAVLYTLITMLMTLIKKSSNGGPTWLRWLWVVLDIAFVIAFIVVSVLTSPNGGSAGPKHCYTNRNAQDSNNVTGEMANETDDSCNLPWGTFILAIISTLLHALTAAFHEVRDHRNKSKLHNAEKHGHAADGFVDERGVHGNGGAPVNDGHYAQNGQTYH